MSDNAGTVDFNFKTNEWADDFVCYLFWDGTRATSEMRRTKQGAIYILAVRCDDGNDYYFPQVEAALADSYDKHRISQRK